MINKSLKKTECKRNLVIDTKFITFVSHLTIFENEQLRHYLKLAWAKFDLPKPCKT